mmetsp:Transcript_32580/g.33227  ORF Transcript_32580/g.33227 Transcript_32580/m.33227 type:complete len:219 (+) Transcript_32580:78-734(+)
MPSSDRSRSRERSDKPNGDGAEPARIFVGNITFNTTEEDLRPLFTKYGTVSELRVAVERDTGRNRGFAFVSMDDPRDARDAVDALTGYELDGRELRVEFSRPREPGRERYAGARSDVCYDWLKNRCTRGSSCRFSHSDDRGGGGGGGGYRDRDDRGGGGRYGRDDDRGGRDRDRDYRGGGRDRDYGRGRDRDDSRGGRDRSRDRGGRDDSSFGRDRDR